MIMPNHQEWANTRLNSRPSLYNQVVDGWTAATFFCCLFADIFIFLWLELDSWIFGTGLPNTRPCPDEWAHDPMWQSWIIARIIG